MDSINAGETAAGSIVGEPNWAIVNRASNSFVYGLLRLELVHGTGRKLEGARLLVRFAGHEAIFPGESVVAATVPNDGAIRIHLVTHLVPNGMQELTAELIWADGSKMVVSRSIYRVENVGSLAHAVRQDLQEYGTPVILSGLVDSRMFPLHQGHAQAWFNDPNTIVDVPLSFEPAKTAEAARMHLIRWGFAVLDYVIERHTVEAFRDEYETAIDEGRLRYARGTSERIQQAHRLPSGRKIWLDQHVLGFLREWFRDEPCACQTLLYVHGSTQDAHQDTIHLTPYPDGFMCGVWVALQDVVPDSGELFVLPGSHRTPRIMTRDLRIGKVTEDYSAFSVLTDNVKKMMAHHGFEIVPYRPKAGQVLVWHENLIHGGSKRINPSLTRHSIVSHYFARGSIAYYDARGEGASMELLE